jgi:hypothetical protein
LPYEYAEKVVYQLGPERHKQWIFYLRGEFASLPPNPLDMPTNPYYVYAGKG